MKTDLKLLTKREAADLSGISIRDFYYLIKKQDFEPFVIQEGTSKGLVNPEVIPIIKEYYTTHRAAYHFYYSHEDYFSANTVASIFNLSYRELVEEILKGKWEGKYIKIPKCRPPQDDYNGVDSNYFFIKEKVFEGKYNLLSKIAEKSPFISAAQLRNYQKKGLLPQPDHLIGTHLYNENDILDLLPKLKLEVKYTKSNQLENSLQNSFDLLSLKQQQIINRYLKYRENGGVIDYEGYRSKYQIANKNTTLASIRRTISVAFVLIIAGRCGIEGDFQKNPLHRMKVPEAFNPDVFDIYSVSQDDYFFLASKRKGKTLFHYYHQLRAFYYYLLDRLEEDSLLDLEAFRKYTILKRKVSKFLKQFPRKESELSQTSFNKKTKTFLKREEMVLIKEYLLEDVRARDPIKNATMWQFSCTTGVRPEELYKLRINHFQLNSEGYIQSNDHGWGTLILPTEVSKQENSPSHPDYHTPIPMETVKQLNKYLKLLYNLQGDHPRGSGYLFRPDYVFPEKPYKKPIQFSFINRLRTRLDFLDENRRQDFIFKASRHSLNNLIMTTYISKNPSLNDAIKKTAADHQLRHKPSRSVGEEYYMDDITKEQYYAVLDATINFPWDLDNLKHWEIKMGYRVVNDPTSTSSKQIENDNDSSEFHKQLKEIELLLEKIKEKPKNMTELQWIKNRQSLIDSKNLLLLQIKGDHHQHVQ